MDVEDLHFYNPHGQTDVWQNRMAHWQQDGAVYFVTFHLGDSIPQSLLTRWESERTAWLRHHPKPWGTQHESEYHRRFSGAMEGWLDAGHGACVLRDPPCRRIVADALTHFDGTRCHQLSWVIMPNHVHVLFILPAGSVLKELIHSWKSFTSKEVNSHLKQRGTLWQKDYFDRLVRDGQHLDNCIRYIRRNPSKARLRENEYTLYESAFAKSVS